MEFDKSRIYSAGNADELKAGDKVCVADTLMGLENRVRHECVAELEEVLPDYNEHRFKAYLGIHNLAYLVERKENCTNCGAIYTCAFQVREHPELEKCKNWKPKTEQKAEEKNCYNCRFTYTKNGVMRCKMNDHRCNNPEVACNHYEPTTFEKHYRPFKDTDELIKVFCEKTPKIYDKDDEKLFMPYIWVREKGCNKSAGLITCYGSKGITVRGKGMYFDTLFTMFEFLDGSPCGVEE